MASLYRKIYVKVLTTVKITVIIVTQEIFIMKNNKTEQNCENCRYYLQHSAKSNTYFTKVFCGHCTNPLAKARDKRKKYNIVCEHWEPIEIRERERKEAIERTLRNMAKQIESIAMILKDDEQGAE